MNVQYFRIKLCPLCGDEFRLINDSDSLKHTKEHEPHWLCQNDHCRYSIPYIERTVVELPNGMGYSLRKCVIP